MIVIKHTTQGFLKSFISLLRRPPLSSLALIPGGASSSTLRGSSPLSGGLLLSSPLSAVDSVLWIIGRPPTSNFRRRGGLLRSPGGVSSSALRGGASPLSGGLLLSSPLSAVDSANPGSSAAVRCLLLQRWLPAIFVC